MSGKRGGCSFQSSDQLIDRRAIIRLHPARYYDNNNNKKLALKSGKWGTLARTSVRTKGKGEVEKRLVFPIGTSEPISLDGLAVFPKADGFSATPSVFEPGFGYIAYNFEKFGAR